MREEGEVVSSSKRNLSSKDGTEGTVRRTSGRKTIDVTSENILRWWNEEVSLTLAAPKIQVITKQRLQKFLARIAEFPTLRGQILAESKLVGEWARGRGFLTFDWLMCPTNLPKFLEGNYRDKKKLTAIDKEKAAIRRHFNVDR